MNEFTLKRLDHLLYNRRKDWPNTHLMDCATDIVIKADNEGFHKLSEWELEMANSLVEMMISQPNYKPDYMDEY